MTFKRVVTLLDAGAIGLTLNSYPFIFRESIGQQVIKNFIHVILLSHFPIYIGIIIARLSFFTKAYIARAYVKVLLAELTTLHSESSARTINLLSRNPIIWIVQNPRHILNTFFISLGNPARPAILLIFLLSKEEEHNLTTPLTTHHPTCPRLFEQRSMTLSHFLILIYRCGLTSIILIIRISYSKFFSQEAGFISCAMDLTFIINNCNASINRTSSISIRSNFIFNNPSKVTCVHKQTLRNSFTHLQGFDFVVALFKEGKTFLVGRNTRINLEINSGIADLKLIFLYNYAPATDNSMFYTVIARNRFNSINQNHIGKFALGIFIQHLNHPFSFLYIYYTINLENVKNYILLISNLRHHQTRQLV